MAILASSDLLSDWGHARQIDRQAPRAPIARLRFEHTGQPGAAGQAGAGGIEPPFAQAIPVAPDHTLAATRAIGTLPAKIVDVADIDIAQPVLDRDASRFEQGQPRPRPLAARTAR